MKILIVIALSVSSIFGETSHPFMDTNLSEDNMNGRIINGYPNNPGDIPYIVGLVSIFGHFICGGSIIDNKWIVTAAHCLANRKAIHISYGTTDWAKPFIQHYVEKENFFVHEGYHNSKRNDIALIKTPFVEFSDLIKKINLPKNSDYNYAGNWARTSGWGLSAYGSHKLLSTEMKILSNFKCSLFHLFQIYDTHICTGISISSACHGDSGGPLVLDFKKNEKNGPILIGITSFGIPYCIPGYPNVFTRVTKYLDWIKKTME